MGGLRPLLGIVVLRVVVCSGDWVHVGYNFGCTIGFCVLLGGGRCSWFAWFWLGGLYWCVVVR